MSDIELFYSFDADFSNISSINQINGRQIKKHIDENILVNTDYESISFNSAFNNQLSLLFINKQTSLTTQEETDIASYLQTYTPVSYSNKYGEIATFDAVVSNDPFNPAKYSSLETAINDDKKFIFIKSSPVPYTLLNQINFKRSNIYIYGENYGSVIIDFSQGYTGGSTGETTAGNIETPSLSFSNTGESVSLTNSSTTVTGTSTVFYDDLITNATQEETDKLASGDYSLFLNLGGTAILEVDTINSNTSITLKRTYNGITTSFNDFSVGYYTSKIIFKNIILRNCMNTSATFNLKSNIFSLFENVSIENSIANGICFDKCLNINLKNFTCNESNLNGIIINDCYFMNNSNVKSNNNKQNGLYIKTSQTKNSQIDFYGSFFDNNSNEGVKIGDTGATGENFNTNISLNNCSMKNNNSNGIYINNYYNSGNTGEPNSCYGITLINSKVSLNNKTGIVAHGELVKISKNCIGQNKENGIIIGNRYVFAENNFICYNAKNGIQVCSNNNSQENKNISIHHNLIKQNSEHGIQVCDDNISGLSILNCTVQDNTLNSLIVQPDSATTFTSKDMTFSSNRFYENVEIGGKTGSTDDVHRILFTSNFLKDIIFTDHSSNIKFFCNFTDNVLGNTGAVVADVTNPLVY